MKPNVKLSVKLNDLIKILAKKSPDNHGWVAEHNFDDYTAVMHTPEHCIVLKNNVTEQSTMNPKWFKLIVSSNKDAAWVYQCHLIRAFKEMYGDETPTTSLESNLQNPHKESIMEKKAKLVDLVKILVNKLDNRHYACMVEDEFNGYTARMNNNIVVLYHNNNIVFSTSYDEWQRATVKATSIKSVYVYHNDLIAAFEEMYRDKTEWVVYSSKHKVSQYFADATVNRVIDAFEQRLKTKIEISDFTIIDVKTNKPLKITAKVQVVEYVVE